MNRMRLISTLLVLAAAGARAGDPAPAGSPAGGSLTLAWVEERVRESNPGIVAALARARAARSMAAASADWPEPGLGVTRTDFPRPGFAPGAAGQKSVDFYLDIPFPAKTLLARRAATAEGDLADAEARAVIREQVFMARQAYWDLVVATGTVRVLERARGSLAGLVSLSGRRNQFGQVGRMEQLMDPMARMEQSALKAMTLDLVVERRMAEAELGALMGRDPAMALGEPVVPEVRVPADAAWLETGLDDSPAVAVALGDLRLMRAKRDQAAAGWLPDLMLQYSAVDMRDGARTGMAMAKVTLPFVWFWRPAAGTRAAGAGVAASEAMVAGARLEVRRLASEEVLRLGAVREKLAIFDAEVLPQADLALDLAVSGYQSGSVGPADVLTAVRSYVSMNIERLMIAAQSGRSAAVLSRLRGE